MVIIDRGLRLAEDVGPHRLGSQKIVGKAELDRAGPDAGLAWMDAWKDILGFAWTDEAGALIAQRLKTEFETALGAEDWAAARVPLTKAERLRAAGWRFELEPYVRFEGLPGEQGTFFVRDPSGNALEFKTFRDDRTVFARS